MAEYRDDDRRKLPADGIYKGADAMTGRFAGGV